MLSPGKTQSILFAAILVAGFACETSWAQAPSPDPVSPLPMSPVDSGPSSQQQPQYNQQSQPYAQQPYQQQPYAQQPYSQYQQPYQQQPYQQPGAPSAPAPLQGGIEHSQTIQPPPQQMPLQQPPAPGMPPFPLQTQHWNPYPQGRPGQGQVAPLDRLQKTLLPGWLKQNQMLPQLFGMPGMNAPVDDRPLQGKVDQNETRPSWLPAWAYSNDSMTAPYHSFGLFGYEKKPMPPKPQWMRLAPSVTRYWNGHVPDPCLVYSVPMPDAPGNFTFKSGHPDGPRGWLQFTPKTNAMGFPIYRYWLDRR